MAWVLLFIRFHAERTNSVEIRDFWNRKLQFLLELCVYCWVRSPLSLRNIKYVPERSHSTAIRQKLSIINIKAKWCFLSFSIFNLYKELSPFRSLSTPAELFEISKRFQFLLRRHTNFPIFLSHFLVIIIIYEKRICRRLRGEKMKRRLDTNWKLWSLITLSFLPMYYVSHVALMALLTKQRYAADMETKGRKDEMTRGWERWQQLAMSGIITVMRWSWW